jgi:hypothetical protein
VSRAFTTVLFRDGVVRLGVVQHQLTDGHLEGIERYPRVFRP